MIDITNRHTIGVRHELLAATFFVGHGWEVYFPFMTQSRSDFVIAKGNRTLKVQVKTVSKNRVRGYTYKQTRLLGNFNKPYKIEDFDLLIAIDPDGGAYIARHSEIVGRSSLCFGSDNPTPNRTKRDYVLDYIPKL